jgi:hypothetical protein
MTPIEYTYLLYITISITLTVWVAKTLHKNGRLFLIDRLNGNQELADSLNHLLVVGFYLINIGYISLALKTHDSIENFQQIIEVLSGKIGFVLVVLGIIHFTNLLILTRTRKAPPKALS